jgi:putative tricarboxylic transport membrane protein
MTPQSRSTGALVVAAGIVAVGLVVGYETTQIQLSPAYAKVGPKVFPTIVSAGLILLGLALLWQAWSGAWHAEDEDDPQPIDWRALGWLGFGLAFNVALIDVVGFIVASTVLFAAVARAFGSIRPLRDLASGFVFAAVVYLGFAKLLGINMGSGMLERFL